MHAQCKLWCEKVKERFSEHFKDKRVLEIGSANINGVLRYLFEGGEYIGIDVKPYDCVDVVSIAHKYDEPPESFDVIYSTSTLEHDKYFKKTLQKMVELLKPGGLMFFTAGTLWAEHGTPKNKPEDSLTSKIKHWIGYYHNLEPSDVTQSIDLNKSFSEWEMHLDSGLDLDFWGIKR